jgi:hypothetical protein
LQVAPAEHACVQPPTGQSVAPNAPELLVAPELLTVPEEEPVLHVPLPLLVQVQPVVHELIAHEPLPLHVIVQPPCGQSRLHAPLPVQSSEHPAPVHVFAHAPLPEHAHAPPGVQLPDVAPLVVRSLELEHAITRPRAMVVMADTAIRKEVFGMIVQLRLSTHRSHRHVTGTETRPSRSDTREREEGRPS